MNFETHRNNKWHLVPWVSLISCIVYYVFNIYLGEEPLDVGDGLEHFAISKQSWKEPIYFIDHWGKPLFVFFSSIFAQFGFKIYSLFNVVVFALTILLITSCLKHFRIHSVVAFVSPLIFVSIPDYSYGIVAGLTEPFFGFLLVFMFWSAIKEKWLLFTIIASFIPFARSEGAFVLAMSPFVLLTLKQWKNIPFLTTGFICYAIAGYLLNDQPMWYFENDPYPALSPYGHGNWNDYLITYKLHLGVVMVLLSPIMFFGWFVWRQFKPKKTTILTLYFIGIYLGIIVIHSYFWANGLRGSLGLTRIATQGLPVAIAIGMVSFGFVIKELHFIAKFLFVFSISMFSLFEIRELNLPVKSNSYNKTILKSCNYINQHQSEIGTIYYFHPLIAYFNNTTTKEKDKQYMHSFTQLEEDVKNRFKKGDVIIRDSKFGPVEQGLPFDKLDQYPWIVPVKHFYTNGSTQEISGEKQSVIIYQVEDRKFYISRDKSITKDAVEFKWKNKLFPPKIKQNKEFYNLHTSYKLPSYKGSNQSMIINYKLIAKEPIFLVFDDGSGEIISNQLLPDATSIEITLNNYSKKALIYLYNPSKQAYTCEFHAVSWRLHHDIGLLTTEK